MGQHPKPPPPVHSFVAGDRSGVIVSLPCELCGGEDESCLRCAGQGIELWRVPPEEAALEADELRRRNRDGQI